MKKAGIIICQIILTIIGLRLLYSGTNWAFTPYDNMTFIGIEASVPFGINMIKTDIGAPLMGIGIFLLLFVSKGNRFFLTPFIFASLYFVVRTVSYVVDGSHPVLTFGIGMELVALLALLGLYKLR